jgi:hypothetical protein
MGRLVDDSFFSRIREGYIAHPYIPRDVRDSSPDENGFRWTVNKQLLIPDFDSLRDDCIE